MTVIKKTNKNTPKYERKKGNNVQSELEWYYPVYKLV